MSSRAPQPPGAAPPPYRNNLILCSSSAALSSVGGLIDKVVENVPHDGSGADALSLEFANERKRVGVGLESSRAIRDPGQPVGGSARPGFLSDVTSHLPQ